MASPFELLEMGVKTQIVMKDGGRESHSFCCSSNDIKKQGRSMLCFVCEAPLGKCQVNGPKPKDGV